MAKEKTVYVCSNCGQESPKWVGKCPSCGEWNTYVEEVIRKEVVNKRPVSGIETEKPKPIVLSEIEADDEPRIDLHDEELNRVLGGGLVPGSLVLIGGEPGIGKSTLVLQTVLHIPEKRVLYVSGEESARQLKLRADRLSHNSTDCLIVCETSLEQIFVHIKNTRPAMLPSLLICPISNTGVCVSLAKRRILAEHSRTCAMLPGDDSIRKAALPDQKSWNI